MFTHRSRGRRSVQGLGAALFMVAMLTAGCGVSGGDEVSSGDATTTTEGDSSTTTTGDDGDETATSRGDDGGESTTTEGDDTTTTSGFDVGGDVDAQVMDALIQAFTQMGLDETQARCLADGYVEAGLVDPNNGGDIDMSAIFDLFGQCGISMTDLAELGGEMGQ